MFFLWLGGWLQVFVGYMFRCSSLNFKNTSVILTDIFSYLCRQNKPPPRPPVELENRYCFLFVRPCSWNGIFKQGSAQRGEDPSNLPYYASLSFCQKPCRLPNSFPLLGRPSPRKSTTKLSWHIWQSKENQTLNGAHVIIPQGHLVRYCLPRHSGRTLTCPKTGGKQSRGTESTSYRVIQRYSKLFVDIFWSHIIGGQDAWLNVKGSQPVTIPTDSLAELPGV